MNYPFSDRIEDYEILERLGEGGFAVVHKARCKSNSEEVAIKIINIKKMRDKGLLDHVKREAHIHYRLSNPSILKMHNIIEDKHNVYLILELCHHGSLSAYLKRTGRKLTEQEAKRVFAEVVNGVLYLHKHRIMHRDLSPSNLLVTKSMDIKISDFGLAVMLEDVGERHHTMCGTPNYIAPEIATQVPHGLESDVWSLGCLLYTLLVGRPPFDTAHPRDTLQKVAHADQITIPSNISREGQDLIMGLMKKHPSERLKVFQILDHPFMRTSSPAPVKATTSIRYPLSRISADSGNSTMASTRASGPLKATYRPDMASSHTSRHTPRTGSVEPHETSKMQRSSSWECASSPRPPTPSNKENHLSRHSSLDTMHLSTMEGESCKKLEAMLPRLCSTARLRPLQKHTSSLIITITDTKKVCLQTLHPERGYEEVMEVSSNGMEVSILRGTKSAALQRQSSYALKDLPPIYWKKYRFLAEFVEKLCAQTPKVTVYSEQARNMLMENDAFVARFYSGREVHLSSEDSQAKEEGSHELQHAKKALNECRKLEAAILALEATCGHLLPACAGRRGSPLDLEACQAPPRGWMARQCGPSCASSSKRSGERYLCSLCPPLCTTRLSSLQKRVKNKRMISVTESKKVLLQTLDPVGDVQEMMEISGNGLDVVILRPLKSCTQTSHAHTDHAHTDHKEFYQHHVFSYHILPQHYWSKYQFAAQFVEVLRSSTPKVTMYSDQAKNVLMENENFEACFYNGNKISLSPGRIHFIMFDGSTSTVGEVEDIPEPLLGYYRHADQALRHCRRIESELGTYLPITVGCSATDKTGHSELKKPLDAQVSSGCGPRGEPSACLQGPSAHAGGPHVLKKVFIPCVGWALQLSTKEIWINYSEGGIEVAPGGKSFKYVDSQGSAWTYHVGDKGVPLGVRQKLEQLPLISKTLASAPYLQPQLS